MEFESLVVRIPTSRCTCYSESEVARSCPTLCDPVDRGAYQARLSRQEYWRGLPFPSPEISPFTFLLLQRRQSDSKSGVFYLILSENYNSYDKSDFSALLELEFFFFFSLVKINGNSSLTVVEAGLEDSISGSAHFQIHTGCPSPGLHVPEQWDSSQALFHKGTNPIQEGSILRIQSPQGRHLLTPSH